MIAVDFNEQELILIKSAAEVQGIAVPDLIRRIVLERIEDEYDLEDYKRAFEEYCANPKTYTLDEAESDLRAENLELRF